MYANKQKGKKKKKTITVFIALPNLGRKIYMENTVHCSQYLSIQFFGNYILCIIRSYYGIRMNLKKRPFKAVVLDMI